MVDKTATQSGTGTSAIIAAFEPAATFAGLVKAEGIRRTSTTSRLLEVMLLDHRDEWLAARLEDLDYGDIGGICKPARMFPLTG